MREDSMGEILFRQLTLPCDDVSLNKLGHLGANHVRPKEFARLLVEDRFDQTITCPKCDGFAIPDKGKPTDFYIVALFLGYFLSQANTGYLRM